MKVGAFKHITVPVDGSSTSQHGVRHALDMAGDDTIVTFCAVRDPVIASRAFLHPPPVMVETESSASPFCEEAKREALTRAVAANSIVLEGHPAEAICECARKNGSDAIVIGTHARTGIARVVLGSVAEGLIRMSPVAVVVVHEDDAIRSGPIGVAIDRSPAAATALATAIQLAQASGSELLLIHAFGSDDLLQTEPSPSDYYSLTARRGAATMIEQAATRLRQVGVPFEAVMLDGEPSEVLLETIEARKCSSVVVGSHGRSDLARLFLGSVSAALVERARVPVIVAK